MSENIGHLKNKIVIKKETSIKLFESKQVRSVWNDEEEKWYFSIVDVVWF